MKWFALLLLCLWLPAAAAQTPAAAHRHGPACGTPFEDPDHRAGLTAYQAARAQGHLPQLAKGSASPPQIGDTQTFNIFETDWSPLEFTLVDQTDAYYLWAETTEIDNGNVGDSQVNALRDALLLETPGGSVDPQAGILVNHHTVFGPPPDYDGDGLVDILLYDIRTSGVGGYVHGTDLNPDALEGQGNQRDVLYLDSPTGRSSVDALVAIAAHEYTHLIHFGFGLFETFIAEGLAEFGEQVNGYPAIAINYLEKVAEHNLPFFEWRGIPAVGNLDYQRAALFTTYLADRVGMQEAARLIQTGLPGTAAYDSILQDYGLTFRDLLADFHLANHLADRALDPRFGHATPAYVNVSTKATRVFQGLNDFKTDEQVVTLEAGAVQYMGWLNVKNFRVWLDAQAAEQFIDDQRGRLLIRLVLEYDDGTVLIREMDAQEDFVQYDGQFDRVLVAITHTAPEGSPVQVAYRAVWGGAPVAIDLETPPDEGVTLSPAYPNPFGEAATLTYTLARATEVRLAVYDLLGREVALVAQGLQPAGRHTVHLEAHTWPAGRYMVRLSTDQQVQTQTLVRVR